MTNNPLGDLRRSAAVMTFGPGAIVDFRADDGAVSAVVAGLEEWDARFPPAGLANPQRISEPRLQRKLNVAGFRLPPVVDESWRDDQGRPDQRSLVAVRFPQWLQCPQCDRIGPAGKWAEDAGRAYRYCSKCTATAPGRRKVFVIPVRFVMACPGGHLDEFPWHFWVAHRDGCAEKDKGFLTLQAKSPGLAGLIVSCPKCGARKSMDGIFSKRTWERIKCHGRRPWLATSHQDCDRKVQALQRGASNMYFPVIESALSIPPWSDALQEALGTYWGDIVATEPGDRSGFIGMLARGALKGILADLSLTADQLAKRIEDRLKLFSDDAILDIRQEEYRQFTAGLETRRDEAREFEVRNVPVPAALAAHIGMVVRALRLREVRAIRGFTRINPPGDLEGPDVASLSVTQLNWLPAVEVRGEGIFLTLETDRLRAWESQVAVVERARKVNSAWELAWRERNPDTPLPWIVTPRFLLVHTFAHALMRQLTLDCGYSSAALRERLYVGEGDAPMAGLLIYTATSDSDGTLGGLQRQGNPARIERAVIGAVRAMEWCSSDPLCIEGLMAAPESLALSACHACVLAPETACEHFNRFLDRALLVGTPDNPAAGFFAALLKAP